MPKLGEPVDLKRATKGAPPVVFQIQPEAYIVLEQPEELRQWEGEVKKYYGLDAGTSTNLHYCCTCSGGCADDCGQML